MGRQHRLGFLDGTLFLLLIIVPVGTLFAGTAALALVGAA